MLKSFLSVIEELNNRQQDHRKEITGLVVIIASQAQKQPPSANLKSTVDFFKNNCPSHHSIQWLRQSKNISTS